MALCIYLDTTEYGSAGWTRSTAELPVQTDGESKIKPGLCTNDGVAIPVLKTRLSSPQFYANHEAQPARRSRIPSALSIRGVNLAHLIWRGMGCPCQMRTFILIRIHCCWQS